MVILIFIIGLCIGSFLNVVIYRVPLGKSIIYPRSYCPVCSARLNIRDLIPVISRIALAGRCRFCRERISIRYPVVELMTGFCFAWAYCYAGFSIRLLPPLILVSVLIAISFIDWEKGIIPFSILAWAALPALCFAVLDIEMTLTAALLGSAVGGGFILAVDAFSRIVFKRPGMGGGDVALMVTTGLYLGLEKSVLALFIAVTAGGIYASVLLALKRADRHGTFAFGPFLAGGCWVALLYGEGIIKWYIYR